MAAVGVLAGCWPAPGQGPDRRAHNAFEREITADTVDGLVRVWEADGPDGASMGDPVVGPGMVHASAGPRTFGFDGATGERLWSWQASLPWGRAGAPLVQGDRVLVSGGATFGERGGWVGDAVWLEGRTGDERPDADHGHGTTVALRGAMQAERHGEGGPGAAWGEYRIGVVDTATPANSWEAPVDVVVGFPPADPPAPTLGSSLLFHAGTFAVGFVPPSYETERHVGVRAYPLTPPATCASDPVEGRLRLPCPTWSRATDAVPVTSPVLGPGQDVMYVGTAAGTLYALDAADGTVAWTAALGAAPSASPALADGVLFVPLEDGRVVTLPAAGCGAGTCEVVWSADVGGAGMQPAVAGGVVVVGTDAGTVTAVRAAGCGAPTCEALWSDTLAAGVTGAPAVAGGRLYVGTADGHVTAWGLPAAA